MKLTRTAAAIVAAGSLLATGPIALAATTSSSTPQGGKITLYVQNGKVLITGAVGDYGTIVNTDATGKVNPAGPYNVAHLKHGTITFNSTAVNKKYATLKPQINSTNCSYSYTVSGPVPVTAGTGEYAGISGSVHLTATSAGVKPRTSGGACTGHPTDRFSVIVGSGSVHFK